MSKFVWVGTKITLVLKATSVIPEGHPTRDKIRLEIVYIWWET